MALAQRAGFSVGFYHPRDQFIHNTTYVNMLHSVGF
jgi:hypothetical protein